MYVIQHGPGCYSQWVKPLVGRVLTAVKWQIDSLSLTFEGATGLLVTARPGYRLSSAIEWRPEKHRGPEETPPPTNDLIHLSETDEDGARGYLRYWDRAEVLGLIGRTLHHGTSNGLIVWLDFLPKAELLMYALQSQEDPPWRLTWIPSE